MENKKYDIPSVEIVTVECDVITESYIEDESWISPEIEIN